MFHFGQSIYRKLQELKLAGDYATDVKFGEECRMLVALAYLPQTDVLKAWAELMNTPGWSTKQGSLLADYFERTYIGLPGKDEKEPNVPD